MNDKRPEESQFYDISMRGTSPDLDNVHLYTDRREIIIDTRMSFDIEYEGISGTSHFFASLLSSVILSAIQAFKRESIELDEIEGIVRAQLTNPLRMIPVRGYEDPCDFTDITIKLFYYADSDPKAMDDLIRKSQESNPIYRLVNRASSVKLETECVL
ncbi:hypothetical protein B8A42_06120 [Dolosigranulum pigrum]|jgi:hypothetical protein|uniref:OsmC family protein n=1 Tax=Dolosigranulum pigrum TaxID=29394 RepID=UPI000DC03FAF|nr:OsmC family protein [Dolosigranulum pigrum]RAN54773.1 hypothetical protein B8A42_06120 [Dolosigranulum pigrum]RAN56054.1 hypothetical protein B8A33_07385 [Dolosigranulum pigrum]VTU57128.1 hypothetical protein AMBR_FBHANALA_01276 [Dolosigranulum pigrum]